MSGPPRLGDDGADGDIHPALRLLERAHEPDRAAAIFEERVRRKPLHLLPGEPDPDSKDARAARRRKRLREKEHYLRRRKPRPLSAKQRRKLGIHDIPDTPVARSWATYLPLRDLWLGYMREILDIDRPIAAGGPGGGGGNIGANDPYLTAASAGPRLASADYHGAEVEVVRSRCVSRVGLRGIVLKDTRFTFELITPTNELKTIPKAGAVFRIEIPRSKRGVGQGGNEQGGDGQGDMDMAAAEDAPSHPPPRPYVFEIHGSQFEFRPADRATKKFKLKRMDDL